VKQILLVEDNAGDVLLIKQVLLETTWPMRLRVAMDGEQALQVLAEPEYLPDLIILDLNIPKVSGLQLLEQRKPTAPIVVFTSSSNPAERERAKELGVREFVQKPIDFGEFSRVVMRIVKDWVRPDASGVAAE
jgi:CheY-like chemotaxis protein